MKLREYLEGRDLVSSAEIADLKNLDHRPIVYDFSTSTGFQLKASPENDFPSFAYVWVQ